MAVVAYTKNVTPGAPREVVTWVLANTDTGQPISLHDSSDKTVQIFGTFGSGGSVTMQGSNDPRVLTDPNNAVWFSLTDPQANAITKTAAAGEAILENPLYIRPNCTAGDGTTALTIILYARRK